MQNALPKARSDSQKKPYRWPQKVHRYGLMPHPFLRLFVALYENKVLWNSRPQGWCAESLRTYIREEMLPSLKPVAPECAAGTLFGDAFYLRRINLDAALNEAGNSYLKQLKQERIHNPQSAEQKAIEYFNREKYAAFKEWWRVMNEHYGEHPDWIYCVLKRMFATSDRGSRAPVPPVRLATVEKLAEAVVYGDISPSAELVEAYGLLDVGMGIAQSPFETNGWTRVAMDNQSTPLLEKIWLLSYFGNRAGWCTAREATASSYLSCSDFYVLCVAGAPRVAIRRGKKTSRVRFYSCVEEVTGPRNEIVEKNSSVDLLIAVLDGKKHIPRKKKLYTGSRLSCLDLEGWNRELDSVPFALHLAPRELRSLDSIREKVQAARLRYVQRDPFWIPYAFGDASALQSLSSEMEATLASTLRGTPVPVRLAGKAILRHPRLRTAWEQGWIRHLKGKATTLGVPRRILASPEIRSLAMDAFKIDLACATVPPHFHAFYGEDPGLLEEYRQAWIRYLRETKNPAAEVPCRFWNDEQVVSAWSEAHMDTAKGGEADWGAPSSEMMREAWCGLWIVALEARFAKPGFSAPWIYLPKELVHQPVIQRTVVTGWLSYLQKQIENKGPLPSKYNSVWDFTRVLEHMRETFGSSSPVRDFVIGYLRMITLFRKVPCLEPVPAGDDSDSIQQSVLNEFLTDSEFYEVWLKSWQEAAIARLEALSKADTWSIFCMPKIVTALPAVRSVAAEAYIAFLRKAVASQNPAFPPPTADLQSHEATGHSVENSTGWDTPVEPDANFTPAPTPQIAVHALAAKTATAFFERLALHGSALGIEIPPENVAGNPELIRLWAEQWPREVVNRIPVENLSRALGYAELGIPASVWEQPAGQLVLRELVLCFLASRGAGRPLATNDALPKAFANDPGMHEIWIAAWERILRTMPREYAVYRRVALNVQHVPRVFWAWLHAVRPLNRLLEEEEAWRTFLLVKSGDPLPPFLPRLEIFERNANLRSLVRERLRRNDLQNRTRPASAGGDFEDFQDFITQGMRSLLSGTAFHLARNAPPQTADFELLRAALSLAGTTPEDAEHSGPRDASEHALWVEASNVLRASPWLIETLPAESARNPAFQEAVLSGWNAYLDVAPWLLPWIPAAWRRHFLKTRSGCRRIPPPPAHTPRKPLCAAA